MRGQFVPAMGLGSIAVSPLDMASAYATLAAGGIYTEPTAIRKVVIRGKPDDRWATERRRARVLSDGVAAVVTEVLEDNVRYGTGTRAALSRPTAGKTGTTDEHADAWFVGYTPGLATAVWMGYTRGEVPMTNVHGISVSGGSFPAEIWRRFMEPALADAPLREFRRPSSPGDLHDLGARAVVAQLRPVLLAARDLRRPSRKRTRRSEDDPRPARRRRAAARATER